MPERVTQSAGGISLITGALLLTLYSTAYWTLLPVSTGSYDMVNVVLSPHWRWIALVAFLGVILLMLGFGTIYGRIRSTSGLLGFSGFILIEAAYLLQACKVTWELFLYPVIAANPASSFLLREGILRHDATVGLFRTGASLTIFLGVVLFCLTLLRSREYPKVAAGLVFVGAITYGVGPFFSLVVAIIGIFTFAMGCFLLGLTVIRDTGRSTANV